MGGSPPTLKFIVMVRYRVTDGRDSILVWQDNWGLHFKGSSTLPQRDYPNASYNAIYFTLKAFEDKGYSIEHLN